MRSRAGAFLALIFPFAAPSAVTGCVSSCEDLACSGAAVEVDLRSDPDAAAVTICVNASCVTKLRSNAAERAGLLVLPLEEVPVKLHEEEDFELDISVLDPDGTVLASISENRNRGRTDPCKCPDVLSYRQLDSRIEPS